MMEQKIKVEPVIYYGYHQGYKVYIKGKKYPRAFGNFYATFDKATAIKSALREDKTKKEQYY